MISGFELAVIIVAITFMGVNFVSVYMSLYMMRKFENLTDKCASYMTKVLEKAEKELEKIDE